MTPFLSIHDNFAPSPDELRRLVLASPFSTEKYEDGAVYTGICKREIPELYPLVAQAVGFDIIPRLAVFRASYENELPHNVAHADTICAEYAGLLYLNPPEQCFGGTALYQHAELGIDRMPTIPEIMASGVPDEADAREIHKEIESDWVKPEKWHLNSMIGMKYNRFAVYPTKAFHGRYPLPAFGKTLDTARLIWVCFFDRA